MLASLEIHNSFSLKVLMDDISNIICQLHHLYLEKYFNQKQHGINFQHLC